MEIYANLLYKLGRKEEAIAKEEAIRYAEKEGTTRFEKTLLKMKAGEKTW